ncbi:MAG TPA: hypothetical protein PK600_05355, partial [Deltaproteobacteria bacterium]|nr:hypothetical protein [Deltaproteobacteria bacterium]
RSWPGIERRDLFGDLPRPREVQRGRKMRNTNNRTITRISCMPVTHLLQQPVIYYMIFRVKRNEAGTMLPETPSLSV